MTATSSFSRSNPGIIRIGCPCGRIIRLYAVDIPAPVTALTWTRLLDPAEPVAGALAWQGTVAVGLVHHIRHRSCWTAGDYCYLQDLFVAPAARQSGVGRKLIEHVYALAAREGCARVYW